MVPLDGRAFARGSAWAILDQAGMAGGVLVLNVLLAREVPAAQFGIFAVASATLALLTVFHTAFLSEPVLVHAPRHQREGTLGAYLSGLRRTHLATCVALASGCLALGWVGTFASPAAVGVCLAAAMAPAHLHVWNARRATLAQMRPRLAGTVGVLQFMALAGGAFGMAGLGQLGLWSAAGLYVLVCLLAGLLLEASFPVAKPLPWGEVLRPHAAYARRSLLVSSLAWIPLNAPILILAHAAGTDDGGALRAATLVAFPMLQVNAAIGTLALPWFAGNPGSLRRRSAMLAAGVFAVSVGAAGVLWVAAPWLVGLLYGGAFAGTVEAVRMAAFLPATEGVGYVLGSAHRSIHALGRVAQAVAFAGLVAVLAAAVLVPSAGVMGALAATLSGSIVGATWMAFSRPTFRGTL